MMAVYKEADSLWDAYDIADDPLDTKDISSKLSEDKKDKLGSFIARNKQKTEI